MKTSRLRTLACPTCGGALDGAASSSFLDCPSCGTALSVRTADSRPRRAVLPRVDAGQAARAARACWEGPLIPSAFLTSARIEPPRLLFVAFYQVERTLVRPVEGRSVVIESLDRAPAVVLPDFRLDRLDLRVLAESEGQIPFDPLSLQRKGMVFDPSRTVVESVRVEPELEVIEERVEVVYLPVWLVRCRLRSNFYEVTIDGTSGAVLRGRAPVERTARLPQAVGALYLLALASAFVPMGGPRTLAVLLRLHEVGIGAGLFLLAGLAWIVAWSWDRVRFRYEVIVEGQERRLAAIARPERTLPEQVSEGLARLAVGLLRRGMSRRR
jgi:hypothetical protein